MMKKEGSFFRSNLMPLAEEIENVSQALQNAVCEDTEDGMCFLLIGTLSRIARDFRGKIDAWEKEFEVFKKSE